MTKMYARRSKGFTLIEVLVVVSIIGFLSASLLVSINSARIKGRNAKRVEEVSQYIKAIELYQTSRGSFPTGTALGDWYCLGDREPCWGESYEEDAILQGQLSPYIAQVGGNDQGIELTGYLYRCETSAGTICSGYSILYHLEGINNICGPGIAVNASYGDAYTYCQKIVCGEGLRPVASSEGGIYICQ